MRIIDKNVDFYDYLQGVYPDNTTTFDRRASFLLTKEEVCDCIYYGTTGNLHLHDSRLVLLQVCHQYWLFLCEITEINQYGKPTDYNVELVSTWRNYDSKSVLIKIGVIIMNFAIEFTLHRSIHDVGYIKDEIYRRTQDIVDAINRNDYKIVADATTQIIYRGNNRNDKIRKNIPLLKASGFSQYIDAQDVYLAFDEYFSSEKTASERTASDGITDEEKETNHGFDTKTSFRGKRRRE